MASSRKSKSDSISCRVVNVLREQIRQGDRLVLALSGGLDSIVLLDVLVPLSVQMQFEFGAIHVNHGISPSADKWSGFCRELCNTVGVPLEIVKLSILNEAGASLEAVAREERYRAFGKMGADYIVLAQHMDDQAETLMLQLLRGAGVKGLCAMPIVRSLASERNRAIEFSDAQSPKVRTSMPGRQPQLLRPMLDVSRSEIEDYARERQLPWVTDESNDNTAFNRNFLRHEIFPRIEERFPSYRPMFLRTSRHLAEASALLDELAEVDSRECVLSGKIVVESLRKLGFFRAKNLLRYNLARQGVILPSAAKLEEILRQLLSRSPDAKLRAIFGEAEIRCFKGLVHVRKASTRIPQPGLESEWLLAWHGEAELFIDELGGSLKFMLSAGFGISLEKLMADPVTIRLRKGGERLRAHCNRPRRTVKNLLQEASIPPWARERLPLIFSGEHLVALPGIAVNCEFQAADGEQGVLVEWRPDPISGNFCEGQI